MDDSISIEKPNKSLNKRNSLATHSVSFLEPQMQIEMKRTNSHSILKNSNKSEGINEVRMIASKTQNSIIFQKKISQSQECNNPEANMVYQRQFLKHLERSTGKKKFEDQTFPPNTSSLFPFSSRLKGFKKDIKWMRIPDIFPTRDIVLWNPYKVTINLHSSTDLCPPYLLLALNCLRSNRCYLEKLFENQKINPSGIYYGKIFTGTIWKSIIVDDYIPVVQAIQADGSKSYHPVFTTPNIKPRNTGQKGKFNNSNKKTGNKSGPKYEMMAIEEPIQVWMFILQKIFAKHYSSYQALLKGNFFDFMTELTGYDHSYKNIKAIQLKYKEQGDWKQFWYDFFGKNKKQKIFVGQKIYAVTPPGGQLKLFNRASNKSNGIGNESSKNSSSSGRQSLMHLKLQKRRSSQLSGGSHFSRVSQSRKFVPITIVKGSFQKISFFSTSESDRLVHRNTIWPDDVGTFFSGLYTWGEHTYDYWGNCRITPTKQKIIIRKFRLEKKGQTCLSIYQKDKRLFGKKDHYNYCWLRVVVLQKEYNGSFRWVDGEYGNLKNIKIEGVFDPGQYFVLIMPEWNQNAFYDLGFVVRTSHKIKIQKAQYENGMMEQGCADLAQRFGTLNQLNKFVCSYNCIHEEMGLVVENINNQKVSGDVHIRRKINYMKSNLSIEPFNPQFSKDNVLQVSVKPGNYYTVVLMMKGGIDRNFFQNFNFSL